MPNKYSCVTLEQARPLERQTYMRDFLRLVVLMDIKYGSRDVGALMQAWRDWKIRKGRGK